MFCGVCFFFLIALQEKKLYKLCRRHGRNSKRPHKPPLNHTLIPMEPSGANSFRPARSPGPSISDTYTSLEHIVLCLLFMVLVFKTRPKHRLPSPVSQTPLPSLLEMEPLNHSALVCLTSDKCRQACPTELTLPV